MNEFQTNPRPKPHGPRLGTDEIHELDPVQQVDQKDLSPEVGQRWLWLADQTWPKQARVGQHLLWPTMDGQTCTRQAKLGYRLLWPALASQPWTEYVVKFLQQNIVNL